MGMVMASRTAGSSPQPPTNPQARAVQSPDIRRLVDPSRRQLLAGLGLLCSCCPPPAAATAAGGPEWGYACAAPGPSEWAGPCRGDGAAQSPIDLPLAQLEAEPLAASSLSLAGYRGAPATGATCLNTGHGTMQVRPGGLRADGAYR